MKEVRFYSSIYTVVSLYWFQKKYFQSLSTKYYHYAQTDETIFTQICNHLQSNQVNCLLKFVKQVKVTCRISKISEFDRKSGPVQVQFLQLTGMQTYAITLLCLVSAQISEVRDLIAVFQTHYVLTHTTQCVLCKIPQVHKQRMRSYPK